jgi:hypothetical protein
MPNWCNNEVIITGKPKMLNKLLKQITTTASEAGDEATSFDFNKVVPMPPNVDWYGWCVENWGTKWNASDVMFVGDNGTTETYDDSVWESGEVIIIFQTAWSPPIPVMTQLSKDNPHVKIIHKFYETGSAFYGTYSYIKGDIDIVEEGEFNRTTPCEIYMTYMGDSSHHYCNECENYFECNGELQDCCDECLELLNDKDKELWETDLEVTTQAS